MKDRKTDEKPPEDKEQQELVIQVPIPTPFPVGDINAYIIHSSESPLLTLIDTGTTMEGSMETIEAALAKIDKKIEDIDQIIITHAHADHYGLADRLKKRSQAKVLIHTLEKKGIENFGAFSVAEEEYKEPLIKAGIPMSLIKQLSEFQKGISYFADPVEIDDTFNAGDKLDVGDTAFKVIHTPGHTAGSVCFYYAEKNILFSADTLLEGVIPTAFNTTKDEKDGLYNYTTTLKKLDLMEFSAIYPGHGNIFTDHHKAIARYFERHEKRKMKILGIVKNKEKTVFQIAASAFENLHFVKLYLNVNEIIGYVDVLMKEGKLTCREEKGKVFYKAA